LTIYSGIFDLRKMVENARAWLIDCHQVAQKVTVYLMTAVYSTSFKPDCPIIRPYITCNDLK